MGRLWLDEDSEMAFQEPVVNQGSLDIAVAHCLFDQVYRFPLFQPRGDSTMPEIMLVEF